jgi:hypothetical protein
MRERTEPVVVGEDAVRRRMTAAALAAAVALLCAACSPLPGQAREQALEAASSNLEFVAHMVESISASPAAADGVTEEELRDHDWTVLLDDAEHGEKIEHLAVIDHESSEPGVLAVTVFIRQSATASSGLDSATVAVHGCAVVRSERGAPAVVTNDSCPDWLRDYRWDGSTSISLESLAP